MKKILLSALTVLMGIGTAMAAAPVDPEDPEDPTTGAFTLATNATTLSAGDKIIIVAKESNVAMSTTQNKNNRGQADVTKTNNGTSIVPGTDVQVITLEAAGSYFDLNVGNGYLYASSKTANNLKTANASSADTHASITIAADGTATIKFEGQYTRNIMQYNSTNKLFSCYSSASQAAISIYRQGGNSPVTPPVTEPVDPQLAWSADAATVTIGANDNVFPTLTAPEGLAISYSSSDTDVATIDANGTVTLVAAGSTVITAANEATADYIASSVTYTLTVKPASTTPGEPEEPVYEDITATFDFTGDSAYEMELMSGNVNTYNPKSYSFSENGIEMALSGNTRWWSATAGNELRFYKDAGFTITAPENHKIVKVELVGATPDKWDTNLNEYSNGIWTGNADAVKFSTNIDKGNTAIKKVKVELLAVPDFNMASLNYRHADDKSVTLHCTLAHSNYGHVKHYEIWVIDQTPAGAVQLMSMEGENVVGHVLVGATDFASDSFNVEVPLQLAADSGIHHLEVRAQAVLRDNSTQYADTFSDEGEEANVGDTGTDVDTSASGTITTGATIINADSNATVRYYNLQGVEIAQPEKGLYIEVSGKNAKKVVK